MNLDPSNPALKLLFVAAPMLISDLLKEEQRLEKELPYRIISGRFTGSTKNKINLIRKLIGCLENVGDANNYPPIKLNPDMEQLIKDAHNDNTTTNSGQTNH